MKQNIRNRIHRIFAAVMVLAVAIGLFAGTGVGTIDAKAAVQKTGISITGKDGEIHQLEEWIYDEENDTYRDKSGEEPWIITDFTQEENQFLESERVSYDIRDLGALVYSGTQPKGSWQTGTRLAVVPKGILMEDLIDYAEEILVDSLETWYDLRGDTKISFGAMSYKGQTAGQVIYSGEKEYDNWYADQRYYYPEYWNDEYAETNESVYRGDKTLSEAYGDGQPMPYVLAITGFTASKDDWNNREWKTVQDEIAGADSLNALRNFLGQLPEAKATDSDNINLGNLSTKQIEDILFTPTYYDISIKNGEDAGTPGDDLITHVDHASVEMYDHYLKGANSGEDSEIIEFTVRTDPGFTASVTVTDEKGDEVEIVSDGEDYWFEMPASAVTISVETTAAISFINGTKTINITAEDIEESGVEATKSYIAKGTEKSVTAKFLNVKDFLEENDFEYSNGMSFDLLDKDGDITPVKKDQFAELYVYIDNGSVRSAIDGSAGKMWRSGLESITVNGINRLFGQTRYDTSLAIADALLAERDGRPFEFVIVTTGANYPDALSGSYLAACYGNAPILLVDPKNEKVTSQTIDYIKENMYEDGFVFILGGPNAVPESVEKQLSDGEYIVKRLSGATRYDTNLEILKEGWVSGQEILVSTGNNYADCLSASATGMPILLVGDELTQTQKDWLADLENCSFTIVGGSNAVSARIQEQLKSYTSYDIKRLNGATRYETSILVAKEYFAHANEAVLAVGTNFPDGLCGGPLARSKEIPLILTANNAIDAAAAYTKEAGTKRGFVLGGEGLISDEIAAKILFAAGE